VVKPQPFNNFKTFSKFWVVFARSNFLSYLKALVISSSIRPHLLMRNSMTTPLPGGVVDGGAIWVQKLGNAIWDLTVNENAKGGVADWLVITRFHIIIIICAEGRRR
jgi:hypothetical protein